MSNADLIRPIFEQWSKGNWRPRFEVYHPDMEWGWSEEFPEFEGVFADRRYPSPRLRSWLAGWEDWRADADEYIEVGDYVVVLATYRGRGKRSGLEVEQQGAHVFKIRDGKVVRLEIFSDRELALASAREGRD